IILEAPLKAPDYSRGAPQGAGYFPRRPSRRRIILDAIPAIIFLSAPVEQSGVLGSLSRTRSTVQVRSGARVRLMLWRLVVPGVAPLGLNCRVAGPGSSGGRALG